MTRGVNLCLVISGYFLLLSCVSYFFNTFILRYHSTRQGAKNTKKLPGLKAHLKLKIMAPPPNSRVKNNSIATFLTNY